MNSEREDHRTRPQIQDLEALLREAATKTAAPVEAWDPPYCGDIGLSIGADGTWFYQGSAIRRVQLSKLFARVLRRDEDGRYFLVTPAEKVDVKVEDAPFVAVEMEVRGRDEDQALVFRTNLDDVVICGADHPLRFALESESGGVKPYVKVRGRLEALLSRALTYDILELAETDAAGRAGVRSGGEFFLVDPDQAE
ncbi:MAG: DUF1285 domain-containing protein [Alphaproteobacteria bacterium]|nr:DUF1285 domain-containing protein [Alphaproteobacteria bacterium]